MAGKATHTPRSHLFVKRCVACGYECRMLDHTAACLRCGCDLVERPPRSYAEMEGIVDLAPQARSPREMRESRWLDQPDSLPAMESNQTIKRWLLFLILSILLLITIAALAAAALGA